MRKNFYIKNQEITLDDPITFIIGDYSSKEVKDLPNSWMNWEKYFPHIFDSPQLFLELISNFEEKNLRKSTVKNSHLSGNISTLWEKLYDNYTDLKKISKVFQNLLKLKKLAREKAKLNFQINNLEKYQIKLKKASKNILYQSKRDLIETLKKKKDKIDLEYEILQDEYRVHNSKMEQYLKNQKDFKYSLNKLRKQQRTLFQETNNVTKILDKKYSLTQRYKQKLDEIDPNKSKVDHERVKNKYNLAKKDFDSLESQQNNLMQESKHLKKQMSNLRKKNRASSNNFINFSPIFKKVEEKYNNIKSKRNGYIKQISNIETELKDMLKELKSPKSNSDINNISDLEYESVEQAPYTSKEQIVKKLNTSQLRLKKIESIFKNLFKTTNLNEINIELENRIEKIKQKSDKVKLKLKTLKTSINDSMIFETTLKKIKLIKKILNILLKPIEISFSLKMDIDQSNKNKFLAHCNLFDSTGKIINISDLKRVNKSYYYFCFILAIYFANDLQFIPINIENLPDIVTTPQTFINSTKIVKNNLKLLEFLPNYKKIQIVFFAPNKLYKIKPVIKI